MRKVSGSYFRSDDIVEYSLVKAVPAPVEAVWLFPHPVTSAGTVAFSPSAGTDLVGPAKEVSAA